MLNIKNLFKTYKSSKGVTHRALEDVSITLPEKGMVVLLGKSGSGKSTLLNIIGGLDQKDSGDVLLNGHSITSLSESNLDAYRNTYLGFIFQEHNLIPSLNIFENVAIALDLQNDREYEKVNETLEKLGILELKDRSIFEVSGGQRQRVAIARAIVKNPQVLLADEPTGSLDSATSKEIMDLLKQLSKDRLVIVVTHDQEAAIKYADRLIELKDGVVLRDLILNDGSSLAHKLEIVASSIVKIPPKYKLSKEDLGQINQVINKNNKETYVNIETDKNLVKAFYPHLSSAIEDSSLDKDGRFRQYQPVEDEKVSSPINFIKSKLPFKRALKFGLINLKNKKFRLAIMLAIAIISITLFAIGDNFSFYNKNSGIAYTFKNTNETVATIIDASSKFENDSFELIREADIEKIKSIVNKDADVYRTYEYKVRINGYTPKQLLFEAFKGFVEVDDIESLGFTYYKKSDVLSSRKDAVAISKFAASILVRDGFAGNISDLVNENKPVIISTDEFSFCISAIIDTHDDEFEDLLINKDETDRNLRTRHGIVAQQYLYHFFVREGFLSDIISSLETIDVNLVTNVTFNNKNQTVSDIFCYESEYANETYSIHYFDEKYKEDGYVIGISAFTKLMNLDYGEEVNVREDFFNEEVFKIIEDAVNLYNNSEDDIDTYITSKKNTSTLHISRNAPIYGIAYNASGSFVNTKLDSIGLSTHDFVEISMRDKVSYGMLIRLNHGTTARISDALESEGYVLYSPYYTHYKGFADSIGSFGLILRLISLALTIVVVLLLYGFISSSIKGNSHVIGILRALGAGFVDIIKIFALETVLIGIFSFIGSYILTLISAFVINMIYSSSFGFSFLVINVNFTLTLKMFFLAISVVILSMLFPVRRLSKMKPVDVIANRG